MPIGSLKVLILKAILSCVHSVAANFAVSFCNTGKTNTKQTDFYHDILRCAQMQSLLSVFKENGNKRKESCSLFQKIACMEEIHSLWDNCIVLMRDEWREGYSLPRRTICDC